MLNVVHSYLDGAKLKPDSLDDRLHGRLVERVGNVVVENERQRLKLGQGVGLHIPLKRFTSSLTLR